MKHVRSEKDNACEKLLCCGAACFEIKTMQKNGRVSLGDNVGDKLVVHGDGFEIAASETESGDMFPKVVPSFGQERGSNCGFCVEQLDNVDKNIFMQLTEHVSPIFSFSSAFLLLGGLGLQLYHSFFSFFHG